MASQEGRTADERLPTEPPRRVITQPLAISMMIFSFGLILWYYTYIRFDDIQEGIKADGKCLPPQNATTWELRQESEALCAYISAAKKVLSLWSYGGKILGHLPLVIAFVDRSNFFAKPSLPCSETTNIDEKEACKLRKTSEEADSDLELKLTTTHTHHCEPEKSHGATKRAYRQLFAIACIAWVLLGKTGQFADSFQPGPDHKLRWWTFPLWLAAFSFLTASWHGLMAWFGNRL